MKLRGTGSLAAQLICFTLAALIIAQGLTFLISWNERTKALDDAAKSEFFSRARTMTRMMETIPPQFRASTLLASETANSRFWITPTVEQDAAEWRLEAVDQFARQIDNFVDLVQVFTGAQMTPQIPDRERVAATNLDESWAVPLQNLWALPQPVKYTYFDRAQGYGLVIRLDDGQSLNAAFYTQDAGGWWTSTSLASLALTAAVLALIGAFIASRIARPLKQLARSAEAFGRGENLPPLAEVGPAEVKSTAEAFNRMRERLHRFVEDRTEMLAAIGHDLRTPLTSLRLRAEFVSDDDIRQKMLATVEELQSMTEAAIAFARGESSAGPTRTMQLETLVGSVCDDLADLGQPVTFVDTGKIAYRCRPDGVRRALRNLVENAVRYGGRAEVSLRQSESTIDIVVADPGTGIPEAMMEKVFAPFVRLETSRNRDTGGIGLGLSIARAVARQHGGEITLINGEKGFTAIIQLPLGGAVQPVSPARRPRWRFKSRQVAAPRAALADTLEAEPAPHR